MANCKDCHRSSSQKLIVCMVLLITITHSQNLVQDGYFTQMMLKPGQESRLVYPSLQRHWKNSHAVEIVKLISFNHQWAQIHGAQQGCKLIGHSRTQRISQQIFHIEPGMAYDLTFFAATGRQAGMEKALSLVVFLGVLHLQTVKVRSEPQKYHLKVPASSQNGPKFLIFRLDGHNDKIEVFITKVKMAFEMPHSEHQVMGVKDSIFTKVKMAEGAINELILPQRQVNWRASIGYNQAMLHHYNSHWNYIPKLKKVKYGARLTKANSFVYQDKIRLQPGQRYNFMFYYSGSSTNQESHSKNQKIFLLFRWNNQAVLIRRVTRSVEFAVVTVLSEPTNEAHFQMRLIGLESSETLVSYVHAVKYEESKGQLQTQTKYKIQDKQYIDEPIQYFYEDDPRPTHYPPPVQRQAQDTDTGPILSAVSSQFMLPKPTHIDHHHYLGIQDPYFELVIIPGSQKKFLANSTFQPFWKSNPYLLLVRPKLFNYIWHQHPSAEQGAMLSPNSPQILQDNIYLPAGVEYFVRFYASLPSKQHQKMGIVDMVWNNGYPQSCDVNSTQIKHCQIKIKSLPSNSFLIKYNIHMGLTADVIVTQVAVYDMHGNMIYSRAPFTPHHPPSSSEPHQFQSGLSSPSRLRAGSASSVSSDSQDDGDYHHEGQQTLPKVYGIRDGFFMDFPVPPETHDRIVTYSQQKLKDDWYSDPHSTLHIVLVAAQNPLWLDHHPQSKQAALLNVHQSGSIIQVVSLPVIDIYTLKFWASLTSECGEQDISTLHVQCGNEVNGEHATEHYVLILPTQLSHVFTKDQHAPYEHIEILLNNHHDNLRICDVVVSDVAIYDSSGKIVHGPVPAHGHSPGSPTPSLTRGAEHYPYHS